MKNLIIENKYANALLEFINNEVVNSSKEMEGIIDYNNTFITVDNINLYQCFQALYNLFSIEEVEKNLSIWFPYGILISPNDFSYEVVKYYTLYLSNKYALKEKDLFFNPHLFFQSKLNSSLILEIECFFKNYKDKNYFLKNIQSQLMKKESVIINLDEEKFLKSKIITNITDKNKEFLEFLLESEVFSGNSKINYAGKEICLLQYLLLRSLTCTQEIINKMMLEVNKKNLIEIKLNISTLNLSYLENFKEEAENFKHNMNLIDRKMILLKFNDIEKNSLKELSKDVVKI